ncbi:serine hydrolase domain-containing protein [Pedobacter sp. SAFR-022]|uniref:serine hydrolase domain-containing protein n=1 Tax=Pedobacter sp. SAFR-022 TaxID=3436861 RepID=UPI003F7EB208
MRRNKVLNVFLLSILALTTFNACAQDHKTNQQRLTAINSIISSTVVLNNHDQLIPLKGLDKKKVASVNLGLPQQQVIDSMLNKYTKVRAFHAEDYKDQRDLNFLEDDLKYYSTVVVSLSSGESNNARYINFINTLAKSKEVIVALFGNGNALASFDMLEAPIVWTPASDTEAAAVVPQVIFGGIAATAKLKTAYSAKYTLGSGFNTEVTRLKYTLPEDAGVNADDLKEIDKIAAEAIRGKAAPGMVVLVAKDGKVIFNKAYGNHTYTNGPAEKITDIFDLASVTKTSATTPAVMRLFEQQKLNLDTNVGAYIPRARTSPMNNIHVREVMLHQAGFIPFIPFYNAVKAADHSADSSAAYPTKVADGYYMRKNYFEDIMWPQMLNSPIKTRGKYVYSDISMYVMKDMVERLSGKPLNEYVAIEFYEPLGMQTAGFLPRNRFAKEQIVPTENDTYFRKTLLEGYVHDQGAAMVGGVSGHAGLFANANDVAILYQMLLNKGSYGGEQYFKPETVNMFTAKQSAVSRRGLGFDRWDPDTTKKYPSALASNMTYGHTGYTGTCVWVDPARGLVYVFLSNRVHPLVSDQLSKLSVRGRIQDVINKAIDK